MNTGETNIKLAPKDQAIEELPIYSETLRQEDRILTVLWKAKAPKGQFLRQY